MLFNRVRGYKRIFILLAGFNAPLAAADDINSHPWKDQTQAGISSAYVISLGVGPVWEDAGQMQSYYLFPNILKTYVPKNASSTLAEGELFVGILRPLHNGFQYQLGFAFSTTTNASFSGVIWDDGLPIFDNYVYQYQVNHTSIALKGKLLAEKGYYVTPWVSLSLGAGFNQAQNYFTTPLIPQAVTNANFAYNIQTAFTYTVGAGIQKNVSEHVQLGIGYEFTDWGKSVLGPAPGQTLGNGLQLDHLYTNGLTFNATFLI